MRAGSRTARAVIVTLALASATAALGVSAPAAGAENCPYIGVSAIASAFHLKNATAFLVQGPEQPEYAAYRFSLCRAVAWSGATPKNEAQAQAKIHNGEAAGVVIKPRRKSAARRKRSNPGTSSTNSRPRASTSQA